MIKKILMLVLLMAPLSLCAQKFAYYDHFDVMQSMPAFQTAQKELEELGKKYENDLKSMQDEIISKRDAYLASADSLPENMRNRKEPQINDLMNRFQQAQQDNQTAFQQAQQDKLQPIVAQVAEAVGSIAKAEGFVYVMDRQTASTTGGIFINESMCENITAKVKAKLGLSATSAAKATTSATSK